MRLALVFSGRMFRGRPLTEMIEVARAADDAGLDYVCLAEHVVSHAAPDPSNHPNGPIRHSPDEVWPEPLTTLGAFAGATQRIGLMTGILIAPLRPAPLLAKAAATVHALSGGRLVLGVSTSWQEEEYAALGVPFRERGQRLTDTIGACRALWGGAPASFRSPTVTFSDLVCEPRPARGDDIPVWFGGKMTPRLIRRVVELGNGWIPFQGYGESLEQIGAQVRRLREAMRAAGRDPASLDVACWTRTVGRPLAEVLEDLPAMAEAGVTVAEFLFSPFVSWPASPGECGRFFEELARRFEDYRALGEPGGSGPAAAPARE